MIGDWSCRLSACLALLASAPFGVTTRAQDAERQALVDRIPELDRAAIDARKAIHSCEMEIELHTQVYQEKKQTSRSDIKLYYLVSGRKILFKRYNTQDAKPGWQTWCRNCEADGYVLHHIDHPGQILGAGFQRLQNLPEMSPQNAIPDPRLIGFNPMEFGNPPDLAIDYRVGAADRADLSAQAEVLDGQDCVRISAHYKAPVLPGGNKPLISYWIAPTQGHSIVKFEWQSDTVLVTTIIKQRQWGDSGLWFPERYEWTRRTTKDGLVRRTTATVNVKSLNEDIPAERFSIPALGLPPGTSISEIPPRGESKRWNGRELVDLDAPDTAAALPKLVSTTRKWFIRGAIALGAISVLLLLEIWRRRRRSRTSPPGESQCAKPSP